MTPNEPHMRTMNLFIYDFSFRESIRLDLKLNNCIILNFNLIKTLIACGSV